MSGSASTSAAGPTPQKPQPIPAHPAFPSLRPSTERTLPSASRENIPASPSQVLKAINACNSISDVYLKLVPSLSALAVPKPGKDQDKGKASARGEELLALFDTDLSKTGKQDLADKAAGLVFIVSARLHPNHADQPTYNADLLTLATNLCLGGDVAQLHACGPRLADLAWGILRLSRHLTAVDSALVPLQALCERAVGPDQLSGVHAAFLEACLLTRQYSTAYEVVNGVYLDVKKMSPSYLDVITFFHHAGLISAANRHWEKAAELFTMAVSVPTAAASAIQLACAKRAILCGLLHDGKLTHFPKYTAGAVSRVVERNAKEYVKLAEAYVRGDWKAVRGAAGIKDFKEDANLSLLEQVTASIPSRRILKLKEHYSKMRISDVTAKLDMNGPKDLQAIEELLQHMVSTGSIMATIEGTGSSAVVSFVEEDMDYTSLQALSRLKQINQLAQTLEQELTRSGRELGIHRDYLKKQVQMLDNGGAGGKGGKGSAGDVDMLSMEGMPGGFGGSGKAGRMKGVGSNMADTGF